MKTAGTRDGYLFSKGYSYYVFSLLFLLYMFDYIDRMVIVSLFPYLKIEWGLSDTQCGLLVSSVYWSIVILSLPISVVIDRWSRKNSIGLMAVIWSLATAACAFTNNFSQLFIARTVIGAGEAGYAPGGTATFSALFPEKNRSMIVGLWTAALPLGSAIGIVAGGYVAERFGWRHAFGIVALPGLLVAILFFFVRDYKTVELKQAVRFHRGEEVREKMDCMAIVRQFTTPRSLILTYIAFAGNMFLTAAYLSWLPTYFHRVENLPMEKAALKGGLVMMLAIVGFPVGGFLADKWREKMIRARLLFPAITSVVTGVLFFVGFYWLEGTAQYGLILAGGITAAAFSPAAIAVTQDVIHPGLRATSYSFCVIFQNLIGSSLGPLFVGVISDRYDIRTALTIVPIASLVSAVLYFLASFFYANDLARVEKVNIHVGV
ncbi:MAG: MFS transporter [Desulfobacterales bacterium]|nr:MFS transporter [Desulfobacterales bacterium]